jgi:L-cysteine:1D-myo-inositol 2-amino-2-deoxy-alpha-D-glucopyranoside ligase
VLPPSHYVGAVEAMDDIAAYVLGLLESGAATGSRTTSTSPSPPPRTSARSPVRRGTMLALSAERGGDPQRPGKKDPLDPLLWLAARPGEPSWDSPLGRGRPGWHVECTAIAQRLLGSPLDVQGGGSDLLFPHHEMSAAHAEVAGPAGPSPAPTRTPG